MKGKGVIPIIGIFGIVVAIAILALAGEQLVPVIGNFFNPGNMVQFDGCHYPAELGGASYGIDYCGSYSGKVMYCQYDKCRYSIYVCGQDPTDPKILPTWESIIKKGESVKLPDKGKYAQFVVLREFFRCDTGELKSCSSNYKNNDIKKMCIGNILTTEKCSDGVPVKTYETKCEYGCEGGPQYISSSGTVTGTAASCKVPCVHLGDTCQSGAFGITGSESACCGGAVCDYIYTNKIARTIQPRKICGGAEKYIPTGCESFCNSDYCYMEELCGKCSVCDDFTPPISGCTYEGKKYNEGDIITYDCSGGYITQCTNGVIQNKDKIIAKEAWALKCGAVTSNCAVQTESCGSSKSCCNLKDSAGNGLTCVNNVCMYSDLAKRFFAIEEGQACNQNEDICAQGTVCRKNVLLETPIGDMSYGYTCQKGGWYNKILDNISITGILIAKVKYRLPD